MTARYETIVHASNVNSDYGIPVTVYAETRQGAVDQAVKIGWSGRERDARVKVLSIHEMRPQS